METLELALELRRANYGANGERLGFDLYPYTEDQVAAVQALGAAVALHRRRRGADRRVGAARGAAAQGRGARVRDRLRGARRVTAVGIDVGTTGVKAIAIDADGEVLARAEESYALSTPQPGWAEQDPDDWVRAARARARRDSTRTPIGCSGQMHGLVALDEDDVPLRPAILWNDQRTARGVRRDRAARSASTG